MAPPSVPWRVRAAASTLALLITGLGVSTLLADITLRMPSPNRPAVVYIQGTPEPRPTDPAVLEPVGAEPVTTMRATPRATASRRAAPRQSAVSTTSHEPAFAAIAAPTPPADAASAPTPESPERRSLDLGPDAIRSAARESQSAVRRMAHGSGRVLGDEPRSRDESIASSMARAGKPDCLSQKEGGSLLSLITIPYAMMRDQCR